MNKLQNSYVAIFGLGGVGGYVGEALVRSGIGSFDLIDDDKTQAEFKKLGLTINGRERAIDDDKICLTNLNRQIIATFDTVGQYKTDVMKERMLKINPKVNIQTHQCFFLPENATDFSFEDYDYIIDAVDTVSAKIELVLKAQEHNIPIISSMGAGNKVDPTQFKITDIYKTKVCPLAKVMRRELKKRHVKKLKVVYSKEKPIRPIDDLSISCRTHCICPPDTKPKCTIRRDIPGSNAFVPSTVGLIIASEVIKDLTSK